MDSLKQEGRKLLLQSSENVTILSQGIKLDLSDEEKKEYTSSEPQNIPLAIPGMLLLCCGVLCPCFHAKRKEKSEHSVLDRELKSSESIMKSCCYRFVYFLHFVVSSLTSKDDTTRSTRWILALWSCCCLAGASCFIIVAVDFTYG